jgi:hypothetical protein
MKSSKTFAEKVCRIKVITMRESLDCICITLLINENVALHELFKASG